MTTHSNLGFSEGIVEARKAFPNVDSFRTKVDGKNLAVVHGYEPGHAESRIRLIAHNGEVDVHVSASGLKVVTAHRTNTHGKLQTLSPGETLVLFQHARAHLTEKGDPTSLTAVRTINDAITKLPPIPIKKRR